MIYYCDIDHIINEYNTTFFEVVLEKFGVDLTNEVHPAHVRWEGGSLDPLWPYAIERGLSEENFWEAIHLANRVEKWVPTTFANALISFLKREMADDNRVIFITARDTRIGAEWI